MRIPRRFAFGLLLATLAASQPSCGVRKTVRKTTQAVATAIEVVDRSEKLAQGDTSQIAPIIALVLNAGQDYVLVHQEGNVLVAEVREVPVLGLKMPKSDDKRYYLRFDLEAVGSTTRMVMCFFRGKKGDFSKREEPDGIISKAATELFGAVVVALLKSGVVFLK